ncbi:MAG: site-specific integrase [Fimbriimonadaceae bacterium]|nr:site-specific integrase [Fimbriimonadaceae bacterium]
MSHDLVPSEHALSSLSPRVLERNPAAVHLAAQSARARPGVLSSLRAAVRVLTNGAADDPLLVDWSQLRYQHLAALLAVLSDEGRKPAGVNHIRNSVLGVMRAAWRLELIDDGQWLRLKDVQPARGSSLPAGREVGTGELDALIRVCAGDASPAGRRDKALLAVLFGGGLRRNEAAQLTLADYEPEPGRLRVQGKGRKERWVPLAAGAAECLADWLEVRGETPGALFVPINKAGELDLRHLTSQAIYNACVKRARQAGVAAFAPHDARRTLASNALDASGDIVAVSGLLGHSSPTVTAKYDRRGERAKERLASQLHVPYYPQEEGEAAR